MKAELGKLISSYEDMIENNIYFTEINKIKQYIETIESLPKANCIASFAPAVSTNDKLLEDKSVLDSGILTFVLNTNLNNLPKGTTWISNKLSKDSVCDMEDRKIKDNTNLHNRYHVHLWINNDIYSLQISGNIDDDDIEIISKTERYGEYYNNKTFVNELKEILKIHKASFCTRK